MSILIAETGADAILPALEVNPLSRPLSEGGLGGVDAALPATDVNPSSRPLSEGGLGGVDAALPALEVNPLSRPLSAGGLGLVDGLLRRCGDVIDRIEQGEDLGEIARVMVLTIAVCAGVFGAAVGFYRGGLQIPFAAVKLPLVMLLTAGICTPALTGLRTALEGRGFGQARSDPHGGALGRDVALVLVCLARSSLLIAATAPLVLLALTYGVGYHALILWVVLCCAVGGAAGVSLFTAALARRGGQRSRVVAAIVAVVFVVVGGQMAWTLRPYLVRPRTPEVPFVRSIEGSFLDAVVQTADSARGIYHRRAAPLPNGPDIALPEVVDPAPTDVSSRSVSRDVPVSRADSAASDATRRSDVVEVPIGHAEPASSGASPRSVSSDVPISRAAPPEPSTSTNPTDMRRSMSGREPSP